MLNSRTIRDFMEHPVWLEIEATLRARRRFLVRDLCEDTPEAETHKNRGAIKDVKVFLDLPRELLEEAVESEQQNQNEVNE